MTSTLLFPLGAVSKIWTPPDEANNWLHDTKHCVSDLKLGKDGYGFRFRKRLEKLLICLLVFEGGGGSSGSSLLTLLCLGRGRSGLIGGEAGPGAGAPVRDAHHAASCQLTTVLTPTRRAGDTQHPTPGQES